MKNILFAFFLMLTFASSTYCQNETYDSHEAYKEVLRMLETMDTLLQFSSMATENLDAELKVLEELAANQEHVNDSLVATFAFLLMNEVVNSGCFMNAYYVADDLHRVAIVSLEDTSPGWKEVDLKKRANFEKHMKQQARLWQIISRAKAALPPKYSKFL